MSTKSQIGAYGGITARVLREAMSPATVLTGFTVVLGLGIGSFILRKGGDETAFQVFTFCGLTLVLVRFALNGYGGEWGGTIFSSRGGTWLDVSRVALRYLALNAVWAVPLHILGWRTGNPRELIGGALMGAGGGNALAVFVLGWSALLLSPPLFLIASVAADRFADVFRPAHWAETFGGRISDLFLIYVAYLGALGMTTILILPVMLAIGIKNMDAAKMMGFCGLVFGGGLSVTLLGRLCGFFAHGNHDGTMVLSGAAAVPASGGSVSSASMPRPFPVSSGVIPNPMASSSGTMPRPSGIVPRPGTSGAAWRADGASPGGKVILMDAKARVDSANQRFDKDPEGAIAEVEDLCLNFAANPLVLHALCQMQARAGHQEASLKTAKDAMALCLQRGAHRQAAEIFALHRDNYARFELNRDMALLLADHLRHSRDLGAAEAAYIHILSADRSDLRAMKGLLQVAQERLQGHAYEDSRRIHQYLVKQCGESPLAAHMREGLAEAERRLAQAS